MIHFSNNKLTSYFKHKVDLALFDGDSLYNKKIKNYKTLTSAVRLPQISIDSSGLVLTRPDSFLPNVDVIKGEDEYHITIDLPSMSKDDVTVTRNNITTIVRGNRKHGTEQSGFDESSYDKAERKFGDFTMTFKIPEEYDRKWYKYELKNGVLRLSYKRDNDDGTEKIKDGNSQD